MVIEPRVFPGDGCVLHVLADVVPADLDPVLVVEGREQDRRSIRAGGVDVAALGERLDLQVVRQGFENVDRAGRRHTGECQDRCQAHGDQQSGDGARRDQADQATDDTTEGSRWGDSGSVHAVGAVAHHFVLTMVPTPPLHTRHALSRQ